jgi:hypothetical protein
MATIHLTKGAPKSTRLDEASIRKRAATKGDVLVEVKPGEEVVSVNVGWTVEKFVELSAQVNGAKKASANGHKVESGKRKERKASASVNGKSKAGSQKRKSAAKKAPATKKKMAKSAKIKVKGKK